MARWTGTWLTGLASAGVSVGDPAQRGRRLGLPAEGPGSLAPFGARAGAFIVDIVLAALAGGLINVFVATPTDLQRNLAGSVAFAVLTVGSLVLTAQTPGMRLAGLRVRSLRQPGPALGLVTAALRTALLMTFLLALVVDRDGRGLHDRAARTVVVRA